MKNGTLGGALVLMKQHVEMGDAMEREGEGGIGRCASKRLEEKPWGCNQSK